MSANPTPYELVETFARSRGGEPFSPEDVLAYLKGHGVEGVEADMGIEAWETQNVTGGPNVRPNFQFIADLKLPAHPRDVTDSQFAAIVGFETEAVRLMEVTRREWEVRMEQVRADLARTGGRTLGDVNRALFESFMDAEHRLNALFELLKGIEVYLGDILTHGKEAD
jgi:hypothetical protein